jgi:hypothetical protein
MDASGYLEGWRFNPGNHALTLKKEPLLLDFAVPTSPADVTDLRIGLILCTIAVTSCRNWKNSVPFGPPNIATDTADRVCRSVSFQLEYCYARQASLSA